MRRRDLLGTIAAGTLWPHALFAETPAAVPVIGFLSGVSAERNRLLISAFLRGLHELGDAEDRDFVLVSRFAEGDASRLPTLAEELAQLRPDVILAGYTPAAVAARAATPTTPIVCPLLADPIRLGLIESQSRPAGNVTGLLFRVEGLVGKQLEIAAQLIPGLAAVGVLANVASPIDRQDAETAAQALRVTSLPVEVRSPDDLNSAFRTFADDHVQAVVVLVDAMFFNERQRIADLAAAARLPAIYGFRDHVDAGGLISYGVDLADNFRRAAAYVHKILKGTKPEDLPVEFPTKLELVINLKAANDLRITIPPLLFARADEVIE